MSILSSGSTTSAASSSASTASSATKAQLAKDKLDKDLNQFLNLLVTQLQHQDPLEPLDANQFTQQLVQFASVEQQIYQNANLEKLVSIQKTTQVGSMVGYLGTNIEAKGDSFNLVDGYAKISYDLKDPSVQTVLTIQTADEKVVFTGNLSIEAGKKFFEWDGLKNDGTAVKNGPYTAVITAKDREGKLINIAQTVFGRVTGAGAENGNVTLAMGAVDVPLSDILNVQEAPKPPPPQTAAAATTTTTAVP
ncbi:MAG: hypothetical protein JKY92_00665 [Magnetovibrio sp.]|nr:hypothetical protein [Magnetovibrio sp.]